jgi:hypothetical protein
VSLSGKIASIKMVLITLLQGQFYLYHRSKPYRRGLFRQQQLALCKLYLKLKVILLFY